MSEQNPSTELSGYYAWTQTLQGVYYGPGSVSTALPKLLDTLGASKALVVTGNSLYTKTDVVKKVEGILREQNRYAATFYNIGEHSPISGIRAGADEFKKSGADIIVSVGGGSPIDASKAIIYFLHEQLGGEFLRQIAIPTTLSAAENSVGAGYTDEAGQKTAVSSPHLAPSGVILDAELTLATPERLWLSTGIRALDHAVENLYRPFVIPPLKYLCYGAIVDLFKYLPQSKADPNDIHARQKLQVAAWMSLWPREGQYSALGLSHALGHRLGATYGIPHGITSCLTLAPTVNLKAKVASEEDKQWLSGTLHQLKQTPTGSLEGDVVKFSSLINELVNNLGLKTSLDRYDVPREDLPTIAERALGGRNENHGDVVAFLEALYSSP
ncbi:iron-containing alcohol dehydrogenase [Russula ochroleuca]|jgi:alcohol dehydrogenase class IV|uniref:Iron-containing alcohol dehydrogenase n=1 Tax=Russula ochroleuca TaxID=152965 RepID=A0A9P5N034_9AGAM|nr:iron-containing alcohol dehydrogenase [Russula ochroleuca]